MALVGNCSSDKNDVRFTFPNCYARITEVTQENAANGMTYVKCVLYADQAARQSEAVPVVGRIYNCPSVDFPAVTTTITAAGYEYLKVQPDFAGWVDA